VNEPRRNDVRGTKLTCSGHGYGGKLSFCGQVVSVEASRAAGLENPDRGKDGG
jgi:hypothetical protein